MDGGVAVTVTILHQNAALPTIMHLQSAGMLASVVPFHGVWEFIMRGTGASSRRIFRSHRPGAPVAEHASLGREGAPFELKDVRRAIDRLPRRQREVLLLHWLRGLDYAGIARELDVPPSRIRSRIARARTTLRTIIGYRRAVD